MAKASDNPFPSLLLAEQASAPATPAAGHARLYRGTDGKLYVVDDAGVATEVAGIPGTLIDAKGDLLVGSAADTTARLPVGTDGQVLTADSAEAAGVKWAAASGGGGGGLLESVVYNPSSFGNKTLTTSDADIDATNLAVTFTVPASGAVIAKWSALCVAQGPASSGSTVVYGTFREGSSTVAKSRARLLLLDTTVGGFQQRVVHSCKITGLTPSTSKTWKAGAYCALGSGGSPSARIDWGDDGVAAGPNGPALIEIWSA